ncbi:MAG: hypothetical protein MK085_02030 [Phycisphaerales bacterium]|nr:hypothetical protein [Phycisphaerales bacterium]
MQMETIDPAWRMTEPWPATLVAARAGSDSPDLERLLVDLAVRFGEEVVVLELHGSPDDKHPWSVLVRVPGLEAPVLLACQQSRQMSEVPPRLADAVGSSRWVVLAETLLDADDPLGAWSRLAEVCGHDATVPAILDATTGRWFDRTELDRDVFDQSIPIADNVLWETRVVSSSAELDSGTAWLFTTGLSRCDLPELEMLEVPVERVRDAARLVDVSASILLEEGPPPPKQPWPLAPGLDVALVPWREVTETLDPESLGSVVDREQLSDQSPSPFLATRGVICGAVQRGSYRSIWTWPRDQVEALANPNAMMPRSRRALERSAALARRTWPRVAEAQAVGNDGSELVVMAGLTLGSDVAGHVEHGWVQVDASSPEGGEGRLLRDAADGTPEGSPVTFRSEDLEGWRLVSGSRMCGEADGLDPLEFIGGAT